MANTASSFNRDHARGTDPCGAGAYHAFLASISPALVRETPPLFASSPGELELQSLWFSGAFGRDFASTCGKAVRVVQFGHWNHAAGPDFADAAVSIDDAPPSRGAIELDTDVRDWERHGHSTNPDYDGVVLHLFFEAPPGTEFFTRTSCHRNVIQVRLDLEALAPRDLRVGPPYEAEAHRGRCSAPLEAMPPDRIESLLLSAARYRLERKGRRIQRVSEIHGRDQALYQGIAEALGYRHNKSPMTVLAQRAPLDRMRRLEAARRESMLLGMAGFLEGGGFETAPPETRAHLSALWENWWKERSQFAPAAGFCGTAGRWRIAGSRPNNHPHRRVAALAVTAGQWPVFSRLTREAGAFSERELKKFFRSLTHPYWDHHYTLQADRTERPIALVGSSRVREILANQIYPLLVLEHPALWTAYATLSSELGNTKVRRATARLFGAHPEQKRFTRKVFQQQALLQIYEDFCLADASDCGDCPFPEQLRQW